MSSGFFNSTDTTGVRQPPLVTLNAVDVSFSTAVAQRGGYPVPLRVWLDRQIFVQSYGQFAASVGSATNTTTLVAAIGAAAAQGGGEVLLPAGVFPIGVFTLPTGVILKGQGLGSTTLQSQSGASVCTIGGSGAGLRQLILDGVVLSTASIGVDMTGVSNVVMTDVLITRFATGLRAKGLQEAVWTNLSITNCATNADIRGDANAGGATAGTQVRDINWRGGLVSLATVAGLVFEVIDKAVGNILLQGVLFSQNVGSALTMTGVRDWTVLNCTWDSNTINWTIQDAPNTTYAAINTTRNGLFTGGEVTGNLVNGAACFFNGTCANVRCQDMSFSACSINLSIPLNPITFRDCYLDSATTVTGYAALFQSLRTNDTGYVTGVTTTGVSIVAYSLAMQPGQVVSIEARIVAKQRNGPNYASFWIAAGAECAPAIAVYLSASSAFTVGAVLTGVTSKASARIIAVTSAGSSGTLSLESITGTFQSGEIIQDSSGGTAQLNGALTLGSVTLDATGVTNLRAATVTGAAGWGVNIVPLGALLTVQVTGATGMIVEWTAKVDVVVA